MSKWAIPEEQDRITNGLSLKTEVLRKMNAVTRFALLLTSVLPCAVISGGTGGPRQYQSHYSQFRRAVGSEGHSNRPG